MKKDQRDIVIANASEAIPVLHVLYRYRFVPLLPHVTAPKSPAKYCHSKRLHAGLRHCTASADKSQQNVRSFRQGGWSIDSGLRPGLTDSFSAEADK
jgi:hypothetical protein